MEADAPTATSNTTAATAPDAPRACLNCGATLHGSYCAQCGQPADGHLVTVGALLRGFVADQLSLDAALPRTLRGLLIPAFLTREYVSGRIARYIPPFRLYLLTSLLFFLAMTVLGADLVQVGSDAPGSAADSPAEAQPPAASDVLDADSDLARLGDRLGIDMRPRLERMGQLSNDELNDALEADFVERMPIAVFLLVPVFAAFLKLLFRGTKRLYVEHFIFALHLHAFVFLIASLALPFDRVPAAGPAALGIIAGYGVIALKRFYQNGMVRTLIKAGVLTLMYVLCLSVALVTTLAVSFFLTPL